MGCVGIMGQVQGLIEELNVWFPNQLVMDTMGIFLSPILNACRCIGDLFSTFKGAQNILLHTSIDGQSKEENMFLWFLAFFCGGICMLNMVFFKITMKCSTHG